MNLKAKITLLMVALLIGVFGISALAACPAGTIDVTAEASYANLGGPIGDGTGGTTLGEILAAGTYCIPTTGITMGGATGFVIAGSIANYPITFFATVSDVAIVGETPCSTLGTAGVVAIQVNAAASNCTIHNFTIQSVGGGQAIAVNASDCTVGGMQFLGAAVVFGDPVINLVAGQNTLIQNNEFVVSLGGYGGVDLIELNGGQGAQILANVVQGQGIVPGTPPDFFVNNIIGAYNEAEIVGNRINAGVLAFVGVGTFNNSLIADNTAVTLNDGIDLGAATNNTVVDNNNLNFGLAAAGGPYTGLVDRGGSNNQYSNNTISVGAGGGTAIWFQSSNAVIEGNALDTRLAPVAVWSHGINATNIPGFFPAAAGATNATIRNNHILGTGSLGFGINMCAAANTNFLIENNTIENIGLVGILAADPTIGFPAIGPFVGGSNHTIRGNTINHTGLATAAVAIPFAGTGILSNGNNLIENNTVNNVYNGASIATIGGNDDILNNTISNNSGQVNPGVGIAVWMSASNATVVGNTISGIVDGIGIALAGASNATVTGNHVSDTGWQGILVSTNLPGILAGFAVNASNNVVSDNTLVRAGKRAADVAWQRYGALHLEGNADNNTIDNNTIENAGNSGYAVGIDLLAGGGANPDNNDVTNNSVSGFTTVAPGAAVSEGIRVLSGENNTVIGNTVMNSGNLQYGIDIRTTEELPVTNNTVEGMLKAGLYLWGGTPANVLEVQGNILTDNVHGINMMGGASEITNKNVITGGAVGLYVAPIADATNFDVCGVCNNVGNCITACILCQNDGLGTLNARGNYWGLAPIQGATIFGNVDFSDALASCPGTPAPKTHTYGAAAGWYMVSVPLNSGSVTSLYGATAYRWNPALGAYDVVATIEPAKGYWVSLPANKSVTDTGDQVVTDVTINITTAGWHQISAPWSYPKSAIQVIKGAETKSWTDAVTAGWVRDDIYGYVATDGFYTTPSTMSPWYGYWVRAEVSGLSLKLLVASGTPVSMAYAPMAPMAFAPMDLPPMPPTFTPSAATLSFGNSPNPVVDVNTTIFEVKGEAAYLVEALKVQIYDLSGRLVYEAEEAGASMAWHTDNIDGEYLANGVYLYKLYALLDGQWVVSAVKNVVILR